MRYLLFLFSLLLLSCAACDCQSDPTPQEDTEPLTGQIAQLQSEIAALQEELAAAQVEITGLEQYVISIVHSGTTQLIDPDWSQLKRFVALDDTDSRPYILNEFDCEGFAITLRDRAWRQGIHCGYVAIGFERGSTGHTLNAFQTTDQGLVYIDNTKQDMVGYVEIGEIYGTIALDKVTRTLIDCSGDPDQFWKPVTYTQYQGSLFDYPYYEQYTDREAFHTASAAAYDQEVAAYNDAVNEYKQGSESYTRAELDQWRERLQSWTDNLNQLQEELGLVRTEATETVQTLEVYWN